MQTKPCPSHPLPEGSCEPMPSEPWRCVYGDHPMPEVSRPNSAVLESWKLTQEIAPVEYIDVMVEEAGRARWREQRLEAAARAGLFLQRHRTLGRVELEEWQLLGRAAGCRWDQPVPPTAAGLAQVVEAALAGGEL